MALVPNLFAEEAREILETAMRLDGRREGRCVYIEADMDALALLDEAERLGAEEIVLVGPGEGPELERVEPLPRGELDPGRVVKELWMNLTGSLGLDDYVAALRVLSPRGFYVARCRMGCGEVLELVRRQLCLGEGEA